MRSPARPRMNEWNRAISLSFCKRVLLVAEYKSPLFSTCHKQVKSINSDTLMAYHEMGLLDDPHIEAPVWKYRNEARYTFRLNACFSA